MTDKQTPPDWECFSDPAYYDMWCVRQIGSRTFGEGFHLVNGDEAEMLCRFLNARDFPAAALMEQGARLALEAAAPLTDAAAAAIYGLPEMLERNALSDDEGMVKQIEMALTAFSALDPAEIVKGSGYD